MPDADLRAFERELNEAVRQVEAKLVEVQRQVALFVYEQVVANSPVGTGRYRASHTIAVGAPDETVHPGLAAPDGAGEAPVISAPSMAEARAELASLKPFEVVWVANALPYAEAIEQGSSDQAPGGVYAVAVASAEARFASADL
ncbi:MAG: HK97 gp10 family phage protein [Alphaproteobacteria bacterium]